MSTIKTSNIQNGSSSSINIALNTDGSATFAQMPVGPTSYLRNRIINGAMMIDQRNGGASVTPSSGGYTLDRWNANMTAASKFSVQQNAGAVTGPTGFANYLGATSTSSYSVGASDFFDLFQPIEGFNFYDAAWGTANAQPVTLSFWVRSSLTGTFSGYLLNASSNRVYNFSYSIPVANTWTFITKTIAGDITGTWTGATNGVGVYVVPVSYGAGSSVVTSTTNTWQNGAFRGVTGQTNIVATSGATLYLTGVQLEIGSLATPFERRLYPQELAMCQRYFEVQDWNINTIHVAVVYGNSQPAQLYQSYVVTKRAAPTVSWTSNGSARYVAPTGVVSGITLSASVLSVYGNTIGTGGSVFNAGAGWIDSAGNMLINSEL